ncbi:MAG: hypothetical protein EZS28_032898, partial [Streblomastix strix]
KGTQSIGESLKLNETLQMIRLWDNTITPEGGKEIIKNIKENRCILELKKKKERDMLYGADTIYGDEWYLIDEQWLSEWREYICEGSMKEKPGPISNWRLVDEIDV